MSWIRGLKTLDRELWQARSQWNPNTITTDITPSFHKLDLVLDGPPIVNPKDLVDLGINNTYVFSFTLTIAPYITKQKYPYFSPADRPAPVTCSIDYFFTCPAKPDVKSKNGLLALHVIEAWPPLITPLRIRKDNYANFNWWQVDPAPFLHKCDCMWTASVPDPTTVFTQKVSVVLKLPDGYDIDTPIYMHGRAVSICDVWKPEWNGFAMKSYRSLLQKGLELKPIDSEEEVLNLIEKERVLVAPFEDCRLAQMWKEMEWEGAREMDGKQRLTDELRERHQLWLNSVRYDRTLQRPTIDGYEKNITAIELYREYKEHVHTAETLEPGSTRHETAIAMINSKKYDQVRDLFQNKHFGFPKLES